MKSWTCAAILLVLVGCASVPGVPIHLQGQGATIRSSGGPFSARYAGTETGGNLCLLNDPFKFSGTGSATFLHATSESGSMVWSHGFNCDLVGSATLTSSNRPHNSVTVRLEYQLPGCERSFKGIPFTVTGGTGRFANATGNGTIRFACQSNGTYTDQWSGTITF